MSSLSSVLHLIQSTNKVPVYKKRHCRPWYLQNTCTPSVILASPMGAAILNVRWLEIIITGRRLFVAASGLERVMTTIGFCLTRFVFFCGDILNGMLILIQWLYHSYCLLYVELRDRAWSTGCEIRIAMRGH